MAADPRGFIPASDAASGIVSDLALHLECTEIERIILVQSSYGFISATINSTLMTTNAFYAPLTVTASTSTTVTIPGLAAEIAAAMPSCSTQLLGQPVTFASTNLLPTPLQTSTTYYLVPTATTDVYEIAISKQNAFQCPAIVITLSTTPAVVTGTTSITSTLHGTVSVIGAIGVSGTLVINGVSIAVATTDTLAQIEATINAAAIPGVTASVNYTYNTTTNNTCNVNCNSINNCYNNPYNTGYNSGNPNYQTCNCNCGCSNSGNSSRTIATANLVLTTAGAATVIGAGSTAALLTALGLVAGTFGEVGVAGNLIIDGHTVAILATDTLATVVSNINLAVIPHITASLNANGNSLVISDTTGAAITIAGDAAVLTALGLSAGTQAASVVSATPMTQSEIYYAAWKNIYFFPEQQIYTNLMHKVQTYFQSVGYTIIQQQQVDGSGDPIQAFQWYVSW